MSQVRILPGPPTFFDLTRAAKAAILTATARCDGCLKFMNPGELAVRRALVKEVYRGICRGCVRA